MSDFSDEEVGMICSALEFYYANQSGFTDEELGKITKLLGRFQTDVPRWSDE